MTLRNQLLFLIGLLIRIVKLQSKRESPLILALDFLKKTILAKSKEHSCKARNQHDYVLERGSFLIVQKTKSDWETPSDQSWVPDLINPLQIQSSLAEPFAQKIGQTNRDPSNYTEGNNYAEWDENLKRPEIFKENIKSDDSEVNKAKILENEPRCLDQRGQSYLGLLMHEGFGIAVIIEAKREHDNEPAKSDHLPHKVWAKPKENKVDYLELIWVLLAHAQ